MTKYNRALWCLGSLALVVSPGAVAGQPPIPTAERPETGPTRPAAVDSLQADEQALREVQLGTDGASLIKFFKARTLADADRSRLAALVVDLGSDAYELRERASQELIAAGAQAVPLLRQATRNSDIEVVRRAEHCLRLIDRVAGSAITAAAARVLARRNPDGAADALLAFAPFADDDVVVDELRTALVAVALRDGKPVPAVLDGARDKNASRRALAAEALVRSGLPEQRTAMAKLLADPEPLVRLRVGLALADAKDKQAIPTLIGLLVDLPRDQSWQVEDLLFRLGSERAPAVALGNDDASRKKCRDAWRDWWSKNGDKVDLAQLAVNPRPLGYTLIVQLDPKAPSNGKVMELGVDGKPRWTIESLLQPMDAVVTGNDRVLITEYRGRKVSEHNFKGEVVWEKQFTVNPVSAQRLTNGNTFVTFRNMLVELDRNGKELSTVKRDQHDVISAQKLRNGHIVILTQTGQMVRVDAAGKELKSFNIGQGHVVGSNFEVLANGHFLVPHYTGGRVVEYDGDGKQVWETSVNMPTSVQRLPNGNTLVTSLYSQQVQEVDKAGKQIWQYQSEGRAYRARRR